jgi:hypothetical protein
MGKYLIKASYAPEGVKGLMKEGGTGRRNTHREDRCRYGRADGVFLLRLWRCRRVCHRRPA